MSSPIFHLFHRHKPTKPLILWGRRRWMLGLLIVVITVLISRAVYLQVMHKDFLNKQGDARHLRYLPIVAHRGMLLDRNGEALAISTPVDSVWVNPSQFATLPTRWAELAAVLGMSVDEFQRLLQGRMQREFVYLKRHVSPSVALQVKQLGIAGVFLQREYRRYYPYGEITAHILGFTNVDDRGQEGLELALDNYLAGSPGMRRVIQDQFGNVLDDVAYLQTANDGYDIVLSVDRRIQYLMHRELSLAVANAPAVSASAVLLDVHTGEVYALANVPSYNPNNRDLLKPEHIRNRAVTDVFEPGSTLKPFAIATALETGRYTPNTPVDVRPGQLQLGRYTIRDAKNYGVINLTTIIQKSSNVGASKVALSLEPQVLWRVLQGVGFGGVTGSIFPGEASGTLPHVNEWNRVLNATLSYGYGLNVTVLQLARAYAVFGNQGRLPPLKFTTLTSEEKQYIAQNSPEIFKPVIAQQMLVMLEAAVKAGGTGTQAQIRGYRIAGKTGTVRKTDQSGYSNRYYALFAGIVPASAPRVVLIVMINEPSGDEYYGGQVAAPVFATILQGALRLLNIPPDDI